MRELYQVRNLTHSFLYHFLGKLSNPEVELESKPHFLPHLWQDGGQPISTKLTTQPNVTPWPQSYQDKTHPSPLWFLLAQPPACRAQPLPLGHILSHSILNKWLIMYHEHFCLENSTTFCRMQGSSGETRAKTIPIPTEGGLLNWRWGSSQVGPGACY